MHIKTARMQCPLLLLVLLFFLPSGVTAADLPDPFSLMAKYQQTAQKPLWPGFKPLEIPVAVYDGTRILLFGHPAPPAGFAELDSHKGVWMDSGWKEKIDRGKAASLDELLETDLSMSAGASCGFTEKEKTLATERAKKDVADLDQKLDLLRTNFYNQPGWRIEILAGSEPLWPNNFDPWNVQTLKGMDILHSRWVKLGNTQGTIEVLNFPALTEGVGPHPLFNGVAKSRSRACIRNPPSTRTTPALQRILKEFIYGWRKRV